LPRGGLDCYKRAARSTVGVSRSAALVEVGRRRIVSRSTAVVEYGCATVVVGNSCCYSIIDVVRSGVIRSSNQRSYLIVVWDWRHSVTFGRTGCALSRTGCIYGRASSTCCRAFLHTAAHRLRAAAHRLRVATHFYIRPHIVLELPRFVYVLPRISTYGRASKGPLW